MSLKQVNPLQAGQKAPAFQFTENGETISSDQLDAPCLLYFYPKDNTPGCNKEACAFRDNWSEFQEAGLKVIGVSKDSTKSHERFQNKFELPFPLIADTELELANAFGVFGEKSFMGKQFESVHRMSFLIAKDGTIVKNYTKVKPAEHAKEVLGDFHNL